MVTTKIAEGVVHKVPDDFKKAICSSSSILNAWNELTPLARNEWICWVISVKKSETRTNHIRRASREIVDGKHRPCCLSGCLHR